MMSSLSSNLPIRLRSPLRFVHASNLHLDRTVEQVAEGPVHWERHLLDVSWRAAERLFQKVVEENVDFLILSGDVLNANLASPGTLLFLLDQFERLAKENIPVYWAGAESDSPEDWPTAFPLPENVHQFPSHSIQEYYFQRKDDDAHQPIAKIVGMSRNQQRGRIRSSEFPLDPGGLYTIAVAHGQVDPESLSQRRIDYWALGGENQRRVFQGNPRKKGADGKPVPLDPPDQPGIRRDRKDLPPQPYTVHYPGSTVAARPQDIGSFGATLVEVPWGEEPVLAFFPTSPIRWVNDQITLEAGDDAGKLIDEMRVRTKNYRDSQKGDDLMINWFVDVPPGPLAAALRRGSLTQELLNELRSLYGKEEPLTWSVSVSLLLSDRLPKQYYEQQTILGDFLRSVRHFQENPREVIDLGVYLPKGRDTEPDSETFSNELLLAEKVEIDVEIKKDENVVGPEPGGEPGGEFQAGPHEKGAEKKKYRFVQTSNQAENQRRVLREAALVGLELLGGEQQPSKLFTLGRVEDVEGEEEEQ